MKLANCRNVKDLRLLAKKKLPEALFDFIEGGSDDEITLKRNTSAFDNYELIPEQLGVKNVSLATNVLGQKVESPIILAPTGMSRLFHHQGEKAVVKAAGRYKIFYSLATLSTVSIEDIAMDSSGPIIFQLYIHKDRGLTRELIERVKNAGYNAVCVTIDTGVIGNRERDLASGLTMPPKLTLKSILGFALRPFWTFNYLTNSRLSLPNVENRIKGLTNKVIRIADYVNKQYDPNVTWDDISELASIWGGAFAVKGVLSSKDVIKAVDAGATAVILSNHGGRQLDGTPATIDVLSEIMDELKTKTEVILDGGVRRGTHVIKALAMGAKACMLGRPYLWGLAAGGELGVSHLIKLLNAELVRDLVLLGCGNVNELNASHIRQAKIKNFS